MYVKAVAAAKEGHRLNCKSHAVDVDGDDVDTNRAGPRMRLDPYGDSSTGDETRGEPQMGTSVGIDRE